MSALGVDTEMSSRIGNAVLIQGTPDEGVEADVRRLLADLGQDVGRKGLEQTPERVARMYGELLAGYQMDARTILKGALFPANYDDIVVVKDIEFYSLCEHHLLPFFGRANVAYVPDGQVVGLSKIPRIVEMYARRLQLQEQMTREIADCISDVVGAKGVAVAVEAAHLCAMIRGVNKSDVRMTTWSFTGVFREDQALREEVSARLR